METTRIAILMALTIAVSGCADLNGGNTTEPGTETQAPGKGLEITELRVSDNTLRSGQQATILVTLKNYHTEDITITDKEFINTGLLEVTDRSCSPNTMKSAQQDIKPEMECTWDVKVPERVQLDVEQKPQSMNFYLQYNSSLTIVDPLKLTFKPFEQINSTRQIKKTFSNGEVRGTMSVEDPSTLNGRQVDFSVESIGDGRVTSPYRFEYFPKNPQVFENCPSQDEPVVGEKLEFSCLADVDRDQTTTRNIYFSTYYKYAKDPKLNINIVKD